MDLPGEWLILDAVLRPDMDPDLLAHIPGLVLDLLHHYELVWEFGLSIEPGCHPSAFPPPWLGMVEQAEGGDTLFCQPRETLCSWPSALSKSSVLAALLTGPKALM